MSPRSSPASLPAGTVPADGPPPLNPLGIKGVGEAGAIPVGPLFCQAVEDALGIEGLELLEIPLSPSKVWELVEARKASG